MCSPAALGVEGLGPAARVNPFSGRADLKGGKIKLYDSPSHSVMSLSFELLPPSPGNTQPLTPEPLNPARSGLPDGAPPARRCRSLPELLCGGRGLAHADPSPGRGQGPKVRATAAACESEDQPPAPSGRSGNCDRPPPSSVRSGDGGTYRTPDGSVETPASKSDYQRSFSNIPSTCEPVGSAPGLTDVAQTLEARVPALSESAHALEAKNGRLSEGAHALDVGNGRLSDSAHALETRTGRIAESALGATCRMPPVTAPALEAADPQRANSPGGAELQPDDPFSCPGCCLGSFAFPFPPVCLRSNSQPAHYPDINCESDRLIGEAEGAAQLPGTNHQRLS
ncbi:hypothetical protein scyTo_0026661 [Scyliorhinus torazame]|uniref:Uncharacterized protein n=1 Tax=Scyliorhinus torazame TaxID=75743 RepID=A0A401QKN3_SCYTO|nr:hypothetical protein [Scyliorhinus torazame]